MKKITSQKLSKRLTKYGALSLAIAGVADASGQIIYTDVDPDEGGVGVSFQLDFNNDLITDFLINGATLSLGAYAYVGLTAVNANASFLGSSPNYVYPFALNNGDTISSGQATWFDANASFGTMNFASCYLGTGSSNWCGVTDKYLGLRYTILNAPGPGDDTVHYGWARLDVDLSAFVWVVKDFAYNSTPDEAITAGQTVLGLEDNELSKIKVVALNKSIALYNLPQSTNYRLFSLTGQTVLDGKIINSTHVIEANTLATGVYIIELKDAGTNAVIRKKIIL